MQGWIGWNLAIATERTVEYKPISCASVYVRVELRILCLRDMSIIEDMNFDLLSPSLLVYRS